MSAPDSLRSAELEPLWNRIRERLERFGSDNRGRIRVPELGSSGRLALQALLGRRPGATLDLGALEAALLRLDVGYDLPSALAVLGFAVSGEPAARRAERAERRRAQAEARELAARWPEPWAPQWADAVIRAGVLRGLDVDQARELLGRVRLLLDRLSGEPEVVVSRVDLAAHVLGSAHALDSGTRLEAAVLHGLRLHLGPAEARELWEQVGVHLNLTSGPVLTWNLPLDADNGLHELVASAREAGIALHLSRMALERHPVAVAPGTRLLVVENPRIVEAAAQEHIASPVLSTNGQPSSTVLLLLDQLLDSGAELLYHGDFDAAGLAICERMRELGLRPFRMNESDYLQALAVADVDGAQLPIDMQPAGATPWDPALQVAFERERRIVHEVRLLPDLIRAPLSFGVQ